MPGGSLSVAASDDTTYVSERLVAVEPRRAAVTGAPPVWTMSSSQRWSCSAMNGGGSPGKGPDKERHHANNKLRNNKLNGSALQYTDAFV